MLNVFELASEQLREIADASDGTVVVHHATPLGNGDCEFKLSIRFDGRDQVVDGLPIRAREQFRIVVPSTFPFHHPAVVTPHDRFAGFRHVQWRRQLCLYGSSSEWNPEDGMYGFIKRLDAWIRDAACNTLDPDDAPLHPPIAYPTVDRLIVPRANTPVVADQPWFGFAEIQERNHRTEIIAWKKSEQVKTARFAPAILLHKHLPFEYPETVNALLKELKTNGVDYGPFILHLARSAQTSVAGTPLIVVLGTPMRRPVPGGSVRQHLAVWEIDAYDADKLRHFYNAAQSGDKVQKSTSIENVVQWSMYAKVGWCSVREMRPEITERRDKSSPMEWFYGKCVAIWGCGAIGTHVAESVARAGAKKIELVDNEKVSPGILVRQAFDDADIGLHKTTAVSNRLKRINPEIKTIVSTDDLIRRVACTNPISDMDLIIDCTASLAIRAALERALQNVDSHPAIASIAIDSKAAIAMATLSMPNQSCGTLDLTRRLKLEACRKPTLSNVLDAFWQQEASNQSFQPEPGCSESTFIGSNADIAGLAALMLNSIAGALKKPNDSKAGTGWLFEEAGPIHAFSWPRDHTLTDKKRGYSIKVCSQAVREMNGWARRSARTVGGKFETGGLVFGELNDAAGVLWVTEVEGPPPDSHASESHFTCGIEGMKDAAEKRHSRFRGSVDCIGSWHTHPTSGPDPSEVDIHAVAKILGTPKFSRRRFLILILSGHLNSLILGAHAYKMKGSDENFNCIKRYASATVQIEPQYVNSRNVGLALSGGGSRAIAFHLGCMRALQDLGLLSRVNVMSSVSGGSVISAMYAYSNDSFREFDERVVRLLRRGFECDLFRQAFTLNSIWKSLKINSVTGVCFLVRMLHRLIYATVLSNESAKLIPRPVRTFNRTELFRDLMVRSLFGEKKVSNVSRESLHTVINATELRTGSAFRFGSKESNCWRFGTIVSEEPFVADAVAASAAYPVYLPALERKYCFRHKGKISDAEHVLLTDGGVFENLGVSPMEPGRNPSFSSNVFDPDYIICCDAGAGLFDDDRYPTYWPSRMKRSFLSVFRKVQDATKKRLHYYDSDGSISGFALCYLGQQDGVLPWIPAGLPRRDEVRNYPTNFAAMSAEDIERLSLRGELLMRFLVAYYLPDI